MSESMTNDYVVRKDGCYRIAGTRVSLDSVVYAFREGSSPESILEAFPSLTLEQVYGAITYYLHRREEIDEHLRQEEADFEEKRKLSREQNPDLYQKLQAARRSKLLATS
jgi:uncharacterized protein (DUF433 family)